MADVSSVLITKENGEQEFFNPDKLRHSLRRAGAPEEAVEAIVGEISTTLKPGAHTSEIYRRAFSLLKRQKHAVPAARYSLKRALFALGPTGYPFERYVAHIFSAQGYTMEVQQLLPGKCTMHEVDFVGEREGVHIAGEVKFHNQQGTTTDVQTSLYVKARFDDIDELRNTQHKPLFEERWLVTNTRFTDRAIEYGVCAGLKLIGWNYPREDSLQTLIEEVGMHPITCLPSLSHREQKLLVENNIVLCRDLTGDRETLARLGFPASKIDAIIEQSKNLCSMEHHG